MPSAITPNADGFLIAQAPTPSDANEFNDQDVGGNLGGLGLLTRPNLLPDRRSTLARVDRYRLDRATGE
jgi:hypothetical protein